MKIFNSNEFRDTFDVIPTNSIKLLLLLIFILASLVIFGLTVKSHDIVVGEIVVIQSNPPIHIVTQSSGQINLLKTKSNQKVLKGEYLGLIGQQSNYLKIRELKSYLDKISFLRDFDIGFIETYSSVDLGQIQKSLFEFLSIYIRYYHG